MMRAGSNSCGTGSFIALSLCMALAVPLPAQASRLWSWSYTGEGIAASGTFTADDTPDSEGYYKITGITGSRNGVAIISLEPAGEAIPGNPGFPVDNLINASGRLTSHGFGFKTADGNYANPFYADFRSPPAFLEVFTQPASTGFSELPIEFVVAIVPEAKHASLLLTALVAVACVPCKAQSAARSPGQSCSSGCSILRRSG
jgi:hypothetical protein